MTAALLALAAAAAWAGQGASGASPAPFYPRSTASNQSMGAINRDLSDITGRNRDNLVKTVGDADCSTNNGALVGAVEKGGYIYGGSCQAISAAGGSQTIAAGSTFTVVQVQTQSGSVISVGNVPIVSSMWHVVASSVPVVASTGTTFRANFSSASAYGLRWCGYTNSSVDLVVLFNEDIGANYFYSNLRGLLAATTNDQANSAAACYITPNNATDFATSGDPFCYDLTFNLAQNNLHNVTLIGTGGLYSASRTTQVSEVISCNYYGAANITKVTVRPTSGNWNGKIQLSQLDP